MSVEADGVVTMLNSLIDSREVATGLAVALAGFLGTQVYSRLSSRQRKLA